MRYAIDIGHNCPPDVGALGIKNQNEDILNYQVGNMVIDRLRSLGNEVVDCTPNSAQNISESLFKRVNRANENNVDLFISIHFNDGGGSGTEAYAMTDVGKFAAEKILEEISKLGYVNRGVKDGSRLVVIRNSIAPAILIQCCFIDSNHDMNKFNVEDMANAIVKGIVNRYSINMSVLRNSEKISDIKQLQIALNKLDITDAKGEFIKEDGILGPKTTAAIRRFQSIIQIAVDGIPGTYTWNAINMIFRKPVLRVGIGNTIAVRYLQWRIGTYVDGVYGSVTKMVVMAHQARVGLVPDGVVGENTWTSLIG
ncbi:MAG: N-acetylmuramoyl-L-alanine amidase [Bacillota bacterium]|nr:N-acetylmuramoyl-L-alanine amidase [Bacillota bacterium]